MANATLSVPNLLTDAGILYWAPLGTALPTNTVALNGQAFTDSWATPWVPLGATMDGSTFTHSPKYAPIRAAEFFSPLTNVMTEEDGALAFKLMDITLSNLKKVLNGGALTVTPAGTNGQSQSYEPPAVGATVRSMIGWESTDSSTRLILRQAYNTSDLSMDLKKSPNTATFDAQFAFEKPGSSRPWIMFTAGTNRA